MLLLEVAVHATPERGRFPDIEDVAVRAPEPVDAGPIGEREATVARHGEDAGAPRGGLGQPRAQLVERRDPLRLGEVARELPPDERGREDVIGAAAERRYRLPEVTRDRPERAARKVGERPARDRVRADERERESSLAAVPPVETAEERLLEAREVDDRRCRAARGDPPGYGDELAPRAGRLDGVREVRVRDAGDPRDLRRDGPRPRRAHEPGVYGGADGPGAARRRFEAPPYLEHLAERRRAVRGLKVEDENGGVEEREHG